MDHKKHSKLETAGFTLTELLITMSLIGILVGFSYSFFNMAIRQYFELQRDGDAFYSLSQHYQRLANVLRGVTGITSASATDITCYSYFSPNDAIVSQLHYYVSGTQLLADVTPMTGDPSSGGTPITAQKKTYTVIDNFYVPSGVNTFNYLDANGSALAFPITDLSIIKGIKVNLAVSSVAPNTNTQALTIQVSIRNRKTNL